MKIIPRLTKLIALSVVIVVAALGMLTAPAAAQTYQIKMGADFGMLAFEPAQLTIQPGDTVIWVNNKVYPHNVIFEPQGIPSHDKTLAEQLSSKALMTVPNKEVSVTFPQDAPAGQYSYYCQPHRGAGMVGKIVVE